jgi:hypothetical protein
VRQVGYYKNYTEMHGQRNIKYKTNVYYAVITKFSTVMYRGADKYLAWPTSQFILFDSENIFFYASLVVYK